MGWVNSGSAVRQAGSSWKQGNGGASRVTVLCPSNVRTGGCRELLGRRRSSGFRPQDRRPVYLLLGRQGRPGRALAIGMDTTSADGGPG